MRLFLDTNIVIDFMSNRSPFNENAKKLFIAAAHQYVDLFVSDLTIINTIYILSRLHYPLNTIYDALDKLFPLINVVPIGGNIITTCLKNRPKDFEDEAQYLSAMSVGVDYIITRNKKDFPSSNNVLTPSEYLSLGH